MNTIKLILLGIAVGLLVLLGVIRDFIFNPRRFLRDMREANEDGGE